MIRPCLPAVIYLSEIRYWDIMAAAGEHLWLERCLP